MPNKISRFKVILPIISVIMSGLVACSANDRKDDRNSEKFYIVESSPIKSDSYIIEMDKNLNTLSKNSIGLKSVSKGFLNSSQDKNKIYITSDVKSANDKIKSDLIVEYDKNTRKINFIKFNQVLADTVSSDDKYVYTTYNWNGIAELESYNKSTKNISTIKFDNALIKYTESIDGMLYANVSHRKFSDTEKDYDTLHIISPDDLKIKKTLDIKPEDSMTIVSSINTDKYIYFAGTLDNTSENQGALWIYDKEKNTYSVQKTKYSIINIFLDSDKIILFTSNTLYGNNGDSSIIEIGVSDMKVKNTKNIDLIASNFEKLGDHYVALYGCIEKSL